MAGNLAPAARVTHESTLTLLELGILLADHIQTSLATDNLAILGTLLD